MRNPGGQCCGGRHAALSDRQYPGLPVISVGCFSHCVHDITPADLYPVLCFALLLWYLQEIEEEAMATLMAEIQARLTGTSVQ